MADFGHPIDAVDGVFGFAENVENSEFNLKNIIHILIVSLRMEKYVVIFIIQQDRSGNSVEYWNDTKPGCSAVRLRI